MGDLGWTHKSFFTVPLSALRQHIVCLGASGSGKTETLYLLAYGARRVYGLQVIYVTGGVLVALGIRLAVSR